MSLVLKVRLTKGNPTEGSAFFFLFSFDETSSLGLMTHGQDPRQPSRGTGERLSLLNSGGNLWRGSAEHTLGCGLSEH